MKSKKVAIALSGGVDSSVAAYLLKKQGYELIALYMKNWEDQDKICQGDQDINDVALICDKLKIPFYTINFVKEYKKEVFDQFLEECRQGLTPNPDILCNQKIKFHCFYEKAKQLNADLIATGHYCQIRDNVLVKGADPNKDQSYFLYAINPNILDKVLFPVGHLTKPEVRKIAKKNDLITFNKKDSTGICFIGKRNFKTFVGNYLGFSSGDVVNANGQVLGKHDGIAYHTIGQRKGLGIGGEGDPWYVVGKNIEKNQVIVAQGKDHPMLFASNLVAKNIKWFIKPDRFPFSCKAKIRYRQSDQNCIITSLDNIQITVYFDPSQRAITPGQSIVFYQNDLCIGGAQIERAF